MNSITQDILYKQSVVKYSYKHGVTKVAIKFKMHRKTIYSFRRSRKLKLLLFLIKLYIKLDMGFCT